MAVTIELNLDATDVADDILAVKSALGALDDKSNEIDLGDSIDADGITGQIGQITKKLNELEVDSDSIAQNISDSFAEIPDEITVTHDHQTPDGDTGSGDSTGSDPPSESGFEKAAKSGGATDGGRRANYLQRTYGPDITLSDGEFMGDWLQKPKAGLTGVMGPLQEDSDRTHLRKTASWGADDPDFEIPDLGDSRTIGVRTGFGLDSVENDFRRAMNVEEAINLDIPERRPDGTIKNWKYQPGVDDDQISRKGYLRGADPDHKPDSRSSHPLSGVDTVADRAKDHRIFDWSPEEEIRSLMQQRDKAAQPISSFFGDNGLNFDLRAGQNAQLSADELNSIQGTLPEMFNPSANVGSESGTPYARRVAKDGRDRIEDLLEEREEMFSNRRAKHWTELNTDSREESGFTEAEIREANNTGFDYGSLRKSLLDTDFGKRVNGIESVSDAFDGLTDVQGRIGKGLRKFKPTMGKYMQLMAAMIPVMAGLGTQLLGVAAAMGAVGAAGAAMMGLGLLGHGESMAGSMAQAKSEVQDLKRELFQTMQPTMQQFAPIQSGAFDAIPGAVEPIAEEMEGLRQYEDTFYELGGELSRGFKEAVSFVVENEQAISDLTTTFGGLIGTGVLNFFQWLIKSASRNKELITSLGTDLLKFAVSLYNVSMAITSILSNFSLLFDVLLFITELLKSDLVVQIITVVTWLLVFGKIAVIIGTVASAFGTLAGGISFAIAAMTGYTMATWQAYAATAALVGLASGGLALIGGIAGFGMGKAMMPSGTGSGSSGSYGSGQTIVNNNQTYNVQGTDDYAAQKSIGKEIERKQETDKAQQTPDVNSTSTTSDGE